MMYKNKTFLLFLLIILIIVTPIIFNKLRKTQLFNEIKCKQQGLMALYRPFNGTIESGQWTCTETYSDGGKICNSGSECSSGKCSIDGYKYYELQQQNLTKNLPSNIGRCAEYDDKRSSCDGTIYKIEEGKLIIITPPAGCNSF